MRVARESLPLAGVAMVLSGVIALFVHPWAALPVLSFVVFTLWFFRDPERVPPVESGALLSPADGRVLRAESGTVSIFMNVFDVHVCRAPMAGYIEELDQTPGSFLAAYKDEASEHNERLSILIANEHCQMKVTLVAGLVARRIVSWIVRGQPVVAGQRVGLIQFGSRVDVILPAESVIAVCVGERVRAGETVLARR